MKEAIIGLRLSADLVAQTPEAELRYQVRRLIRAAADDPRFDLCAFTVRVEVA